MNPIQDYYDKIAHKYDADRFGNSYGRYIDALEREILTTWLHGVKPENVLDIGCGTGRFLDFAIRKSATFFWFSGNFDRNPIGLKKSFDGLTYCIE